MSSWISKSLTACCKTSGHMTIDDDDNSNGNGNGSDSEDDSTPLDPLSWSRDLEKHYCGEFSFAILQANKLMEDHSQVEVGHYATFVGVYDGHGGNEASRYVLRHLFHHLVEISRRRMDMSEDIIRMAFAKTEKAFLNHVRWLLELKPQIQADGSCVLVGLIWKGRLYVANLGDSRAVMGTLDGQGGIVSEQLTHDHNVSLEGVRREVMALHPDDPDIVVSTPTGWRIKGLIEVSRSIGDAHLKSSAFKVDDPHPRYQLASPLVGPVLSAEPSVCIRFLKPTDKFLIFASDGFWDYVTNEEAVKIVHTQPRLGIASRLLRRAIKEVAKKLNKTPAEVGRIEAGQRRHIHDDITIIVVFFDHELLGTDSSVDEISFKGKDDTTRVSEFSKLRRTLAIGKFFQSLGFTSGSQDVASTSGSQASG